MNRFGLVVVCCLSILLAFVSLASAQSDSMDDVDSMDEMDSMMSSMPMSQTCAMLPSSIMVSSDMAGVQCQQVSGAGNWRSIHP